MLISSHTVQHQHVPKRLGLKDAYILHKVRQSCLKCALQYMNDAATYLKLRLGLE